jgi:hypothetical protein
MCVSGRLKIYQDQAAGGIEILADAGEKPAPTASPPFVCAIITLNSELSGPEEGV